MRPLYECPTRTLFGLSRDPDRHETRNIGRVQANSAAFGIPTLETTSRTSTPTVFTALRRLRFSKS